MSAWSFRRSLCLGIALMAVGCASGSSGKTAGSSGGAAGGASSEGGTTASGGSGAQGGSSASGGLASSSGGRVEGSSAHAGSTGQGGRSSATDRSSSAGASAGASGGGTISSASGGAMTGGTTNSGGAMTTGGTANSGGTTTTGGTTNSGGTSGSGGAGASGGTSGSGGTSATGGNSTSPFVLDWEDNFDSFDAAKWTLQTHSWDSNLAQFSTQNTKVASGILSINLTREPSDTAKPYRGVEMRSIKTLTYGKISARLRFAKGPGVVTGLVAIYTPWPAGDWNEIDIEHLGKSPSAVQLNCMTYAGTPIANPTTSVTPTQDPQVTTLGFDAEADFHQYDIEWTPAGVKFIIDGTLQRTWTAQIAKMKLPQNILFTIWASSSADWAGPISSATLPTSAEIDWIKVYSWKG